MNAAAFGLGVFGLFCFLRAWHACADDLTRGLLKISGFLHGASALALYALV